MPHPRDHALGATAAALIGYVALHAGIGLLFLISNSQRLAPALFQQRRCTDMRLTRLWLDYTLVDGGDCAWAWFLHCRHLVTVLGARP